MNKSAGDPNYTMAEVKAARDRLYQAILDDKHITGASASPAGLETDRQTLSDLIDLMTTSGSIEALRPNNFLGVALKWSLIDGIEKYAFDERPEREFIDHDLENLRVAFKAACREFLGYVGGSTFSIGEGGDLFGLPPEWKREDRDRYIRTAKEFLAKAGEVCAAYDAVARAARRKVAA